LIKLLISPLAWLVAAGIVTALIARYTEARRKVADLLLLLTLMVGLLATPWMSSRLLLAAMPDATPVPAVSTAKIVVVPAGGSIRDRDGVERLTPITAFRVLRAAETFQQIHADRLVMSGRGTHGDGRGETQLMKSLAIQVGVPADRVMVEPASFNTSEHPRALLQSGFASPVDVLFVVTDPSHIRRATSEFCRPFSQVVAVPTEFPRAAPAALESCLPQADALEASTSVIRESIGMGWYALKARRRQ